MVKYDANWEVMNTYENLQIVWSKFFTDKLIYLLVYRYLNSMQTNTNEKLLSYIRLFVIFSHLFDDQ